MCLCYQVVRETERRRIDWEADTEYDETERLVGGSMLKRGSKRRSSSSKSTGESEKKKRQPNKNPQQQAQQKQRRETKDSEGPSRGASTDPVRLRFTEQIETLRKEYEVRPTRTNR